MKKYKRYKDSGVRLIGEIPEHWEVKRLKHIFSFGKGLTITKENLKNTGVPCVNYGEIHSKFGFEVDLNRHKLKCVDESYLHTSKGSLLNQGDIVFADTSEDIEGAGNFTHVKSQGDIFAGYHTVVAKPIENIFSRFFAYQFDSINFRTQIREEVKGIKVYSVTQSILKRTKVWLPPLHEQQQMVTYLDQKISHIDNLIQHKEKKIELLKEKRLKLIENVITDSGVKRIKLIHVTDLVKRPIERKDKSYYTKIGMYNWARGIFRYDPELGSELGDSSFFYLKEGDLIISGQFAWEGSVAIVGHEENNCIASHRFHVIQGKVDVVLNEYLWAYFSSQEGHFLMSECSSGSAGRNRPLNIGKLLKEKVPVPDMKLQREIQMLVLEERKYKKYVEESIRLLKEYRQGLISKVVTGEIRVCEDHYLETENI